MSESRKYVGSDNSDREDFFDKYGNLETTHVDRYGWDGKYKGTDVYNSDNQKIGNFKK